MASNSGGAFRVLLVHAAPLDSRGGAEISLRQHVNNAPAAVVVDTILPHMQADLKRYDVVILANLRPAAAPASIRGLRRWVWEKVYRSPLQGLALRSEIVWARIWTRRLRGYDGYVIKSERDVHPCVTRDAHCLHLNPLRRTECGSTNVVRRAFAKLYNICDTIQFLSPLHRQAINAIVPINVRQCEIAPPLDFDLFRNYIPFHERKRAALLSADAIREAATSERRAREAGYSIERLTYLSVPHERMPEVLNQYQAVVVDPVMLHAFGRLAAEALACGCRVLASERVGAFSWPDPLAACREANRRFWEMVMNVPSESNPRRLSRR